MIISVELVGVDGVRQGRENANVERSVDEARLDDIGLSLEEAKEMPGRDVTVFSDGEIGLQSIVLTATRQPVTHILDWFHLSMRLRHIEQA